MKGLERGTHDCWVIILVLLSLPISERYKNENIWIVAVIPGPKQPKEMDTFLLPFVEELVCLESKIRKAIQTAL